jgi:hypothetical protein
VKKIISIAGVVFISGLMFTLLFIPISAQNQVTCEQDYSVQADDWLSKLADKFYGDVFAYPAIFAATNAKAAVDDSYTTIQNPNLIEIGWKLCLPGAEDAQALLEEAPPPVAAQPSEVVLPANFINPEVPTDIPGGAANATFTDAAIFAWQEFIALNWPALTQTSGAPAQPLRDTPNTNLMFGDPNHTGPLVWQTFRNKVEIYPATGVGPPHGYVDSLSESFGYDAGPQYVYKGSEVGTSDGQVVPCEAASSQTPWVNLDEENEIQLDSMYAGVAPDDRFPFDQILFLAKANRLEYNYAVANGWWSGGAPTGPTMNYVTTAMTSPVAADPNDPTKPNGPDNEQLVSFSNGTIEIKTGWRRLASTEDTSRFHTTTVRYYSRKEANGQICYFDEVWGMVALHIIQKTPSAPYFIYATFGQADNILARDGTPVEDNNGQIIINPAPTSPTSPTIVVTNATSADPSGQMVTAAPPITDAVPLESLYYRNGPNNPVPQGPIIINKRVNSIPQTVIDVNAAAHNAITAYNPAAGSPWNYYKLVNVQWRPVNKPTPGVDFDEQAAQATGIPVSSYYLSNIVVETDYALQLFSGRNLNNDLISDFNDDGTPFFNVYAGGQSNNMGGCMGCHGNTQGSSFSFILLGAGSTTAPEIAGELNPTRHDFIQMLLSTP